MKVSILGAGAFGSALAVTLAKTSKKVNLWSKNKSQAIQINKNLENVKYLKGIVFPKTIKTTSNLKMACTDTQVILVCLPCQTIHDFFKENHSSLPSVPLILCSKGIDSNLSLLQSDIIKKFLPTSPLAILSGPSFASEIAAGLPTALTLACENKNLGLKLQKVISGPTLRIYTSTDIIGTQLGGALKNVVAIACGMTKGANLGENARIAVMTRGFHEIIRLAKSMGSDQKTLYGLAGLGDLCLTCNSRLSRNFLFGLNFNSDLALKETDTVEGIKTAQAVLKLMENHNIEAPIMNAVHLILARKISVVTAIHELLSRPLKEEF